MGKVGGKDVNGGGCSMLMFSFKTTSTTLYIMAVYKLELSMVYIYSVIYIYTVNKVAVSATPFLRLLTAILSLSLYVSH